ncbi:MAG: DUF2306 domain-containing protein [Proteobacteria bacterium]|nr:MAG: DUF2306 domain-containing protein [Pseudomonadota bacterium]
MDQPATSTKRTYRHARVDAWIGAAAVTSAVFIWLIAVPAFGPARQAAHIGHVPMLWAHVAGGIVMLFAGAVALRIGMTREWFRWHKGAGYTYLLWGTLASVTALVRSFDVGHSPGMATGVLAVVWLMFSAMAYRAVRNRRFDQHRDWMIRSYVAAWTFVFCRFWSRSAPEALQPIEADMLWLAWVGPLLITEVLLQWSRGTESAKSSR